MRCERAWGRFVWGAIAGIAGTLVGSGVALVIMFERPDLPFNRALVLFSAVYFFIVGFWKGVLAADLFGAAAQGAGAYSQAQIGDPFPFPQKNVPAETVQTDRSIEVLGLLYFLGAIAVGWYFA